jgi:hypothetical protein
MAAKVREIGSGVDYSYLVVLILNPCSNKLIGEPSVQPLQSGRMLK